MEHAPPTANAFSYLLQRFWYRLTIFFHHWYTDGSYLFGNVYFTLIANLERTFAFRITLENLFQPLYQDYTIMGQIIGPIFRLGRLLVGAFFYLLVSLITLAFYLVWLVVPIILLLQVFLAFLSRPV